MLIKESGKPKSNPPSLIQQMFFERFICDTHAHTHTHARIETILVSGYPGEIRVLKVFHGRALSVLQIIKLCSLKGQVGVREPTPVPPHLPLILICFSSQYCITADILSTDQLFTYPLSISYLLYYLSICLSMDGEMDG